MDFNNKVMETLTAITENNEEDKQDLANLKQSLIDGTFNVKYLTWAIMATNDENGNRIIDTYATIERLTQVLEALTQEISDRKAADDLEKNERKEETSAIINSVNQEISDRTNAVSVLNNLLTAETENRASEDEKVLQYAQSVNEALGNAKTDLQGKIDSEAQTRLTSDNEIKASITSKEDGLKALINSVKNELNGYITTLNNRVNNLPTNYVFDTYESMKNDLLNASNTKYKVGDTLFIKEVNKPDYWVSAILSTKGTYGYYELSEQESKVDLSNYVKISELSREAIEEKFLETLENGITKSFASSSFTATDRNSGIDINNYAQYCADGVSFHKNGMEYPIGFPEKDGVFALISDIPQALKNPFALTINGKVYDGSSAVEVITETITEHDLVRFWHAGIEIQNDGTNNILRFSAFDTELEEFSPHISCQYDGPQYYWVWKFPQISGTFAMESQIPTKLSQLTNDGNYQTNTSDLKDNTTTFTTASTRSNVASGEKLSVSFGKISKYFNDLKAVAFSGDRADIGLGNVDNTSDANKPVSTAQQQALNLKANASDVYTKTETDGLLNDKANSSDVYTKSETDGLLNNKANANNVYTKTEADGLLNNKANKSDVYTKSETDNKINEPLYNLGAYDTITANSDGTYTITRQTGYLVINAEDITGGTSISGGSKEYYYSYKTNKATNIFIDYNKIIGISNNDFVVKNIDAYWIGRKIIGLIDNEVAISFDSAKTQAEIQALCPISIQYKLATSYTEKVEKNHYARYNQRFILEHNKSEAERSANVFNIDNINPTYAIKLSDTEFKATSTDYELFKTNFKENTQYTISGYARNENTSYGGRLVIYYTDNTSENCLLNEGTSYVYKTFTSKANKTIKYISHTYNTGVSYSYYKNLMINEGTTPLPYQPYEGKVVHEKELESITPGIFTKLGNKTNFSFDSGSYLVVANNGMVTVTGTDPLNVGSSANKKYLGIFMVTIAEYDGGQSLRVNTEQVFFADYVGGTISGPTFTIYRLN